MQTRHEHKRARRLARERGSPVGDPQHRLVSEIRQAWIEGHKKRGTVARAVDGVGAQPDIGGAPMTRNEPAARPWRHRLQLRRLGLTPQEARELSLREIALLENHPGLADLAGLQDEDEIES